MAPLFAVIAFLCALNGAYGYATIAMWLAWMNN